MVKKTAKSGSGSHHQQGSVLSVGRNCYHLTCRNDSVVVQRKSENRFGIAGCCKRSYDRRCRLHRMEIYKEQAHRLESTVHRSASGNTCLYRSTAVGVITLLIATSRKGRCFFVFTFQYGKGKVANRLKQSTEGRLAQ